MQVKLITHTPNPEAIIAGAAKLCYSSNDVSKIMEDLTQENIDKFVGMLASMGHESPLEHVSFTFSIDGVSRSCSHQLVRHRLASFSQRSQRYVNEVSFDYVIPDAIKNNPEAKSLFEVIMEIDKSAYSNLVSILIDSGMESKQAYENARAALPNACCTSLVMTMNARELLHFFEKRCCNRAQDEIRSVAKQMLEICKNEAPIIFKNAGPPCTTGECPEGDMSCKKNKIFD